MQSRRKVYEVRVEEWVFRPEYHDRLPPMLLRKAVEPGCDLAPEQEPLFVDFRHPCNWRAYIVAGMCQEALDVASSVDHPHFAEPRQLHAPGARECGDHVGLHNHVEQRYEEEGGDQGGPHGLRSEPRRRRHGKCDENRQERKRKASAVVAR